MELKTLADVIKFVNEYWLNLEVELSKEGNYSLSLEVFHYTWDENYFNSTGDYE